MHKLIDEGTYYLLQDIKVLILVDVTIKPTQFERYMFV